MAQTELIKIFKALADETRLDVLKIIGKNKEVSCQELQKHFDLSQPTLSHHFHKLIEANVILVRKEKTAHFYTLNQKFLKQAGVDLKAFIQQ